MQEACSVQIIALLRFICLASRDIIIRLRLALFGLEREDQHPKRLVCFSVLEHVSERMRALRQQGKISASWTLAMQISVIIDWDIVAKGMGKRQDG